MIDNTTVITGSFNWSPSAAHTNDETLLVIHSPKLAAHFTREMDRLWESAELGVTLPDHSCKVEMGNQPLDQGLTGIGTPRLARGDKLHHKFAVIDNKTVITGSFNWSPSAAHTNDETLLVIESPQLAKHFTRELDRMWRTADLGISERLQRKLERNHQRCASGIQRS